MILLITTGSNNVSEVISKIFPDSFILRSEDFDYLDTGYLMGLVSDNGINVIITYRCRFIIPFEILSISGLKAYNVHPSLLPAFPGLNPWPGILSSGCSESGVTIHRLTSKIDQGEIVMQKTMPIYDTDTVTSARERADLLAKDMVQSLLAHVACHFSAVCVCNHID